jgi:hypothetical protein
MSRDSVLIGASMAALVVLSLVTFFCSNHRRRAVRASSSQRRAVDDVELGRRRRPCVAAASTGLEEAALAAFPTELYSSCRSGIKRRRRVMSGPRRRRRRTTKRRAQCAWRSTRTATSSGGFQGARTRSTGRALTSGFGSDRAARSAARRRRHQHAFTRDQVKFNLLARPVSRSVGTISESGKMRRTLLLCTYMSPA